MKRRRLGVCTAVAANDMQLGNRHIKRGFIGVLKVQELVFTLANIHVNKPQIAANTMLNMNHRIAGL